MRWHIRVAVLAVVGAGTLAGCGLVDAVSMSPHVGRAPTTAVASGSARPTTSTAGSGAVAVAVTTTPGTDPTPPASAGATSATSSPVATVRRTPGDLDAGSVTHTLPAGAYHLVIDYWTTESAAAWTAATPVIVQLSAHLEGGPPGAASAVHRPAIEVTRFAATANDGVTLTSLASDVGQFVLTPPYSYGSALQLPGSSASATSAVVMTQFDLLIETTPTSGAFYRQTVIDTLHLSFAPQEQTK